MANKKKSSTYKALTDSETITSPAKISRLLNRFTKGYNPLTVQIKGHRTLHTSSIISVSEKKMLLDELLPSTGHQLLMAERTLHATGKLDGVDVRFSTSLMHIDEQENALSYCMSLPEIIEYRQRRLSYRARIPVSMQLPVILENKNKLKINGTLRDLSYGGAGIIFLTDNTKINTGSKHNCIINLPDGKHIDCTAELRYAKDVPAQKTQLIGVQFTGLMPEQSQHIGRCINELEREFIEKRAAYK